MMNFLLPPGDVASSSGDPNIRIQIYLSDDEYLDAGDLSLDVTPDAAQMSTLKAGVPRSMSSPQELTLNGEKLNLEMDKYPLRRYYCGRVYLIAEVRVASPVDPNIENNVLAERFDVLCENDTLGFANFQLKPDLPQRNIYITVDMTFTFFAQIMNCGSDAILASVGGRTTIDMKTYMSTDRKLDLGYDAEVELVTLNPKMIGQLKERIPGKSYITLHGKVRGMLPESMCTSPYLFIIVSGGSHVTDSVPENNVRYIDLSSKIRCKTNYIDFSVKSFSLPDGATLILGASFGYQLTATIEVDGDRSVGNTSTPLFRFQFYVSRDMTLSDSDLSLEYGGMEQEAALMHEFRGTGQVSLDSGSEMLHLPVDLKPSMCGRVYVLAVVDSLDWYDELSEYNNVLAHEVTMRCLHGKLLSPPVARNQNQNSFIRPSGGNMNVAVQLLKLYNNMKIIYENDIPYNDMTGYYRDKGDS